MKYKQLSKEERFSLEVMRNSGMSLRTIGKVLKRSPSTLCRELKINKTKGVYSSKKAHHKHIQRRKYSKFQVMKVILMNLSNQIIDLLRKKYSPEQISGYLLRRGIHISSKAIYRFIESRRLEYLLFSGWHKSKRGRKQYKSGNPDTTKKYIEKRPEFITQNDYEMDFIVSRQSTWVLLVLVNRLTKKSHIFRLPNRKKTTINSLLSLFCNLYNVATITTDNDIAFKHWKELEAHLNITIYFTNPYHSWEKGLVENCNKWIRCFIPKKQDIQSVTRKQIYDSLFFLNERPKETLGWRTASEFEKLLVV